MNGVIYRAFQIREIDDKSAEGVGKIFLVDEHSSYRSRVIMYLAARWRMIDDQRQPSALLISAKITHQMVEAGRLVLQDSGRLNFEDDELDRELVLAILSGVNASRL